jgi:hypothetical protein
MDRDTFYPAERNLGRDCEFWAVGGVAVGCCFPKAEMSGRTSCEGVIDDVCLFLKNGRHPDSLTEQQIIELKTRMPDLENKLYIPPGGTT